MLDNTKPKYDEDFYTFPNGQLGMKVTIPNYGQFVVCTPDHETYYLSTCHGNHPQAFVLNGECYFLGLRALDDAIADSLGVRVRWGWES